MLLLLWCFNRNSRVQITGGMCWDCFRADDSSFKCTWIQGEMVSYENGITRQWLCAIPRNNVGETGGLCVGRMFLSKNIFLNTVAKSRRSRNVIAHRHNGWEARESQAKQCLHQLLNSTVLSLRSLCMISSDLDGITPVARSWPLKDESQQTRCSGFVHWC